VKAKETGCSCTTIYTHNRLIQFLYEFSGNVEVIENRVTVCRDAVKGACMRPQCKYYHIPVALPPAPLMAIASSASP